MRRNDVYLEAPARTQELLNIEWTPRLQSQNDSLRNRKSKMRNSGRANLPLNRMTRNSFYLEAPGRTRELFDVKSALKAAGFIVGSTWHDEDASSSLGLSESAWIAARMEQLNQCAVLVVVCGKKDRTPLQVPFLAGQALACGLEVIWIGSSVQVTANHGRVSQFETVEQFRDTLLNAKAA